MDAVLAGSLQRAGTTLRITAQLKAGEHRTIRLGPHVRR